MSRYHAVMLDETGCEFGVSVPCATRSKAYDWLNENYPESRCVQLESKVDTRKRETAMYRRINRDYGWED